MKNTNWLGDLFEAISSVLNGAEKSFLDLLSVLVPYFVPVIPAYLTYFHTKDQMDFPNWVAVTAAFVVEVLGITAVSTAIRFWRNNLKYTSEQNRAPFWLAVVVYIFYLVVVLAVNVLLEVEAAKRTPVIILAIALFSLLSVPSGVLISIRSQYTEMLEDRHARRQPVAQTPALGFSAETSSARIKHASDYRDKMIAMLDAEYIKTGKVLAPKDITSRLKLDHTKSKGFVSGLTSEWKRGKGIQ